MKICEIEAYFDRIYPPERRSPWDHDGLMICADRDRTVRRVMTCLDVTFSVIEEAVAGAYDLIISHHPLIFHPLDAVNENTMVGQKVLRLMQAGIAVLSLHTRLDAAQGGLNDAFASSLGVVPESGVVFLPEEPYIGGIGTLEEKLSPEDYARRISRTLNAPVRLYSAGLDIRRVAYCCGAGKDLMDQAMAFGADAFVSGDLTHHATLDAVEQGMTVIDCGHHASEKAAAKLLARALIALDSSLLVTPVEEKRGGEIIEDLS